MAGRRRRPARKPNTNSRVMGLMIAFGIIIFIALFFWLFYQMIIKHDFYAEQAVANQTRDIAVSANRGTIYDNKGNILAISATVQNVILSPGDVEENNLDKDLIASGLSKILDIPQSDIYKRLERTNSKWEKIASRIEDDLANKVRSFIRENKLSAGLYLVDDSKRYYPADSLAAQVIGFVNSENSGAYGLEALYDETLSGRNGRVVTTRTAGGREMLFSSYEAYVDAENGYNLNLTIDSTIQHYADRILDEGINRFQARNGGFCIVMDPKTSAILAMSDRPTYNLNEPGVITDSLLLSQVNALKSDTTITEEEYATKLNEIRLKQWRSKAINDTYEPGSTFKPVVVAAALEEGVVTPQDTFYCGGSKKVDIWTIHCSNRRGHGTQDLRRAVMNSCNPAFMEIGQRLGAETFYRYMQEFGFLESTGVDMTGEGSSFFWPYETFVSPEGLASLATASFGQRFQVTPLHLINAISCVINGGYLRQPYVVQSVTDGEGNVVSYHEPDPVRQVVSRETSEIVRSMMESVVSSGTGKNAKVAGFRIGGKTGTSETLQSKSQGRYIVSFVGFAPADDPQVVALLAYDWPQVKSPYPSGGTMAAPMAGELLSDIMNYLGQRRQNSQNDSEVAHAQTPALGGQTLEGAQAILSERGLNWNVHGTSGQVTAQLPAPGSRIPRGSVVELYLGEPVPEETVPVPSLTGRTYVSAKTQLEKVGLYINASGTSGDNSTLAFSQSIAPDVPVLPGSVIEVRFTDDSIRDDGGVG